MKVDSLLAQYLYQYKTLPLPGIGTFTFEGNASFPDDNKKAQAPIEGISYSPKCSLIPDDQLIEYIKSHTGKMKPLAIADLESYIALAQQFLNIGKPFFIEGVGTLQKNKDASFSFAAGTAVPIKVEDGTDNFELNRKSVFLNEGQESDQGSGGNSRRLFLVAGIVATLAVIGFGGYYLYSKNNKESSPASTNLIQPISDTLASQKIHPDTSSTVSAIRSDSSHADSVKAPVKPEAGQPLIASKPPAGSYKFVFETTTNKVRALKRYKYLKDFSKVQLETRDSVSFKIYVILHRSPADTLRVKDSLNNWYYGKKPVKVTIE